MSIRENQTKLLKSYVRPCVEVIDIPDYDVVTASCPTHTTCLQCDGGVNSTSGCDAVACNGDSGGAQGLN